MIHQQSFKSTIMEVKEDSMTSLVGDKEPTFRIAHFLKPIANSINHEHELNLNHYSCSVFEPKEGSLKINFNGWRYPNTKWVKWVDQLKPKYESVWKKAGIFEAIMSTKSHIMKNQDLVYGVVEKWCSETNTFVFPFGEATITLEDVVVLGGYSLFGSPISKPLKDQEMKEVEQKLNHARSQLHKTKSGAPRTSIWMDIFIDKGSEIEHEAFLATWLSIFVFPHNRMLVKSCLFPIVVRLARGNTIALAPSVLASLYKDLSLFKKQIVNLKKCSDKFPLVLDVNVQSPFYLVQVWVWERFKNLQPQPKLINYGDPLLLRWDMVKALKIENVRLALDSATDYFIWRPYVRYVEKYGMFYPNDEILLPLKKDLDKKILSFVISLRVSELVGFECIEQYLPHRVAMQFGIDQDVPGCVPRFSKANVTTRYAKLWKRSATSTKCSPPNVEIPLNFPPPKLVGTVTFGKPCDYSSKSRKVDNIVDDDVPLGFFPTFLNPMSFENQGFIPFDTPSSSHPKHNTLTPLKSVAEDRNHVLEDVQFNNGNESKETCLSNDRICDDIVDDVPSGVMLSDNSLEDGLKAERNIDVDAPSSLPPSDCQSKTETENYSYLSEVSIVELEQRISRLERMRTELKKARLDL
ncbi:hypothetical protein P8452_25502 [Trifolium repens]|nr:hypothetical protein P8452_25502 [Trifolium repens]